MSQAPTTGSPTAGPRRPAAAPAPRGRQGGVTIDPIRVLRQNVKLLAAAVVAGAVLGTVVHFAQLYIYPVWSGTVVFEINPDVKDAKSAMTENIVNDETVSRIGQTESKRLSSKSVLEAAMRAPDIKTTDWGQEYPTVDERVEELEKTLKVGHLRGTSNFALSWSTQNKADVPVVLNRIAYTYMDMRRTEDDERFARSLQQYEAKKATLDEDIRRQSEAIQTFIATQNITDNSDVNANSQLRTKIENTSKARDDAISEVAAFKSRIIAVDRKIESGIFEEQDRRQAMDDYSMRQLQQLAELAQTQWKAKGQRFGADHPALKALENAAIQANQQYEQKLKEAMQRNLLADKMAFEQRIASAEAIVAEFTTQLAEDQRRLEDLTARATELTRLKKGLENREDERKDIQQMIIQVELLRVREDTQRVKLRQAAVTPREISFPKLQYYIPLGAVMMLGLVAGIVFLREFMDQRVRQPSDLMGLSGCRLLGVVPDISDDPSDPGHAERVVTKHPNSVTAEMFRQVASQARKAVEGGALRTIAVVSAHPEGGTSTLVTNLAACSASAGRRTAVVDANFRRPKLAELYGIDPESPGVGDMLKGVAVKPHMVDGVAVYPAGTSANRTLEMLLGGEMGKLLSQLREEYDFVLIDLPPALVAGESMVIVHASDASMLVVRALEDHRGLVGKMVGQLLDTSATLVGCVLMRPMHTAGGYFKKNAELMAEYSKEQKAA